MFVSKTQKVHFSNQIFLNSDSCLPLAWVGASMNKTQRKNNLAANLVKNTVAAFVYGVKTNALVDTGTSISVISTAFVSKTSFENSVLQTPDFEFDVEGHLSAWQIENTNFI